MGPYPTERLRRRDDLPDLDASPDSRLAAAGLQGSRNTAFAGQCHGRVSGNDGCGPRRRGQSGSGGHSRQRTGAIQSLEGVRLLQRCLDGGNLQDSGCRATVFTGSQPGDRPAGGEDPNATAQDPGLGNRGDHGRPEGSHLRATERHRSPHSRNCSPFEHYRDPGASEPECEWIQACQPYRSCLRSTEAATVLAEYLRLLGFDARTRSGSTSEMHMDGWQLRLASPRLKTGI